MNHVNQPLVVKRGGFLSAIAYGFFGLLTAIVVCSAGLGIYALRVVDHKVDAVLGLSTDVLHSLPESLPKIRKSLPPALADALNDERRPEYRENVAIDVRLVPSADPEFHDLVINAQNNGDKTITLMALRVVLVDDNEVPVRSVVTYAATPMTLNHDWRGPILPGSLRQCGEPVWRCKAGLTPRLEVADLRVWSGPQAEAADVLALSRPTGTGNPD